MYIFLHMERFSSSSGFIPLTRSPSVKEMSTNDLMLQRRARIIDSVSLLLGLKTFKVKHEQSASLHALSHLCAAAAEGMA